MDAIGRWHGLVIDCPDPARLASFYQALLGMVRVQDEGDWVVIGDAADRPGVAFQRSPGYVAPRWPSDEASQQMHFDVRVDDLDVGEQAVLALGLAASPTQVVEKGIGCSPTRWATPSA